MSWVVQAIEAINAARRGETPPVEFLPPEADQPPRWIQRPDAADTGAAAVVRTSGSTGTPKQTLLPWGALEASAQMTAEALGGHGQWLLTLQPSYVAGLAVLTRSLIAGTTPVALLDHTTAPHRFAAAAARLSEEKRFTSLVPTQLARLVEHDDDPALLAALQRFDAILIGGGAASDELIERAKELNLRVVRTYGMSETCGGCVYDGYPLPGVSISTATDGRVHLAGPMLADGYLADPELSAEKFRVDPATGERQFRTDDLGALTTVPTEEVDSLAHVAGAGHSARIVTRLHITGRADDVITTGGVKVSAEQVRQTIEEHPRVREAFVTGVEDPEWGQRVAAAVVLAATSREAHTFEEIDQLIRDRLGAPAVPKHYELLGALPLLPNGKTDRQQVTELLKQASIRVKEDHDGISY